MVLQVDPFELERDVNAFILLNNISLAALQGDLHPFRIIIALPLESVTLPGCQPPSPQTAGRSSNHSYVRFLVAFPGRSRGLHTGAHWAALAASDCTHPIPLRPLERLPIERLASATLSRR